MSKDRFPLTSQEGLSAKQQIMLDALNLDQLREGVQMGVPLDADQKQRLKELEEKAPHMGPLSEKIAEMELAQGR